VDSCLGWPTQRIRYHVENRNTEKNAFDIVITNKGISYKTDGKKQTKDYYAFGKKLIAPCDGARIVLVVTNWNKKTINQIED
jgi:hypothetical protein